MALRAITYEGASIQTCDSCGGEFMGPDELRTIVETRDSVFGPELRKLFAGHKPMFGVPDEACDRTLPCPGCQGAMNLVNYASDTGIAVDRCNSCGGVWLDHSELEKVQLITESWQDQAPAKLNAIADKLEATRRETARCGNSAFAGSRFAFVNAIINRLLDAA